MPTLLPSERHYAFAFAAEGVGFFAHDPGMELCHLDEPTPGRNIRFTSRRLPRVPSQDAEPGQASIASVYAAAAEQNPHVGSNPNILNGKPCILGTRIPVALVLRYLSVDDDPTEDLDLTRKDINDCLQFAATVCDQPVRHVD